ncbi:MAG: molecular chaperone DnaK, partial [bacterium]
DAKNEAENIAFQVENALKDAGDKLDASTKGQVEADLANLKSVNEKYKNSTSLGDSEIAELKDAKEKLLNSAQQLFAKMYEQTQQQAGPQAGPQMGPQGGPQPGGSNDDVVDADYTEV